MAPNPRPSSREAGQLLLYLSAVRPGSKALRIGGLLLLKLADKTHAQKLQFAAVESDIAAKRRDET